MASAMACRPEVRPGSFDSTGAVNGFDYHVVRLACGAR
jgi:hypothetical protein